MLTAGAPALLHCSVLLDPAVAATMACFLTVTHVVAMYLFCIWLLVLWLQGNSASQSGQEVAAQAPAAAPTPARLGPAIQWHHTAVQASPKAAPALAQAPVDGPNGPALHAAAVAYLWLHVPAAVAAHRGPARNHKPQPYKDRAVLLCYGVLQHGGEFAWRVGSR